jgi:hypothetical protein
MITPVCSKCGTAIPPGDINVANDVAYCRTCNLSHSLSNLTHGGGVDAQVDLANPPAGVWYQHDGMERVVGATNRSLGTALGSLVFALFWNGIVSVFVLVALAGTLKHLGFTVPHWFPAPELNGGLMGVGMTLFLWIFLTPFILIGLTMIGVFVVSLGGRTEVRVRERDGVVFTGVGGLGWRRRFDASAVKEVRIDDKQWRDSDGDRRRKPNVVIETNSGKPIKFGSLLTEERRKFVAGAVRQITCG